MKTVEGINFLQLFSVEGNTKARRLFEEAVTLSPENPVGYCLLGWVHLADIHLGSTKSPWESFEKALALAQKAMAMDDSGHPPHALLSQLYIAKGEYDRGLVEGERALALDPGGWASLIRMPIVYALQGDRRKPYRYIKKQFNSTPMVYQFYI